MPGAPADRPGRLSRGPMSKRARVMDTDRVSSASASSAEGRREALLSVGALSILGLTAATWFSADAYAVAGYDFATSLVPIDDLTRALYLWDERLYTGTPNLLGIGTIPYFLLQHVSAALAGSLYRGQMIFFTVMFLAPGLAMYLFVRTVFSRLKDRNAMALLAAVFYMLNTFVVIKWNRGELITIFSYGILPLCLALFERFLARPTIAGLAVFNVALFFYPVTLGHSADFVIVTAVFASFALWRTLLAGDIKLRVRRTLLAAVSALATGAWWVVPFASGVLSGSGGVAGITSFTSDNLGLVDYYSSWATLLSMMKMWFFAMYPTSVEFSTQFYRPGTLLFPMIAFSALLFGRDRSVLFFALSALAGVWLSKGTHAPYRELYEWMYLNVPYFFIFRAPTRYFPLVYVFSITVLAGYAVVMASRWIKRRLPSSRVLYRVPPAFLVVLVFFHSWPLFSRDVIFRTAEGDVLYPSVFMDLPSYYPDLNGWLAGQDGYFRVHSFSNQAYLNYTWGYSSTDIAPKVLEVPQTLKFSQELLFGSPGFHNLMGAFDRTFWRGDYTGTAEVLGLVSARYLTSIRDVMRRYLPSTNYYETLDVVLGSLPGLEPAASIGPATVYENRFALPHVYSTPAARVVEAGPSAVRTLAAGGYLEGRPALVFAGPSSTPDLPDRGRLPAVAADANIVDVACMRLSGRYGFRPGPGSNGFHISEPGRQLVWRRTEAGAGAGSGPGIDGLSAKGADFGSAEGVAWKYLGAWETSERGEYVPAAPGGAAEFVIVPSGVWEDELSRVRGEMAAGAWTRVFRVKNRVGPVEFTFYAGEGELKVEVDAVPAFGAREVAAVDEDYTGADSLEGWIFEEWAEPVLDGGVRISGAETFRMGRRVAAPGVDIEEFPYLDVEAAASPDGFFDMAAMVWLDINGDAWPDGQIRVPVLKGGEKVRPVDMTDLLKEKFGYPGRPGYNAVRVVFDVHRAEGAEGDGPDAGGLSVTFRRLRFLRVDPVYGGATPVPLPAATVDGEPVGPVIRPGPGFHTLGLKDLPEGDFDYVIKVSPASAGPAGKTLADGGSEGPVTTWRKISPTRYAARVERGGAPPFWLVFNEAYNDGWKAFVRPAHGGDRSVWAALKDKYLPVDGRELGGHIMVNGFANGWWVDGEEGEVEIIMDYSPQGTMYGGAALSIASTALLAAALSVALTVRIRRGRDKGREA